MIKNALKFIIAAAIMGAVAFGTVFLASSRSLPFLPKDAPEYSTVESEDEYSEPASAPEESSEPVSHEGSAPEESSEEISEDILAGFEVFAPGTFVPGERRYSSDTEKIVLVDYPVSSAPAEDGTEETSAPDGTPEKIGVEVRMGFVFLSDGRTLDSSFDDITSLVAKYKFLGVRDSAGRPVFAKGETYFNYDRENGLVDSPYDVMTDVTGFEFDVPVYLCEHVMPIKRYYIKKKKYYSLYGEEDGNSYAYGCKEVFEFYPFIENGVERGIVCTIKRTHGEDRLIFYSTRFRHITEKLDNLLSDIYYPPESRGIESIGYFYFCDGYIRVRVKTDSGWEERLMDTGCNLARTLYGYNVKAYSDGCILYERDGLYGFTTNSLNWIAPPDLLGAQPFTEGLAVVTTSTGKGMIDTNGNYVLPPVFDEVTRCSGGVFAAYSEQSGWSFFAKVPKDLSPAAEESAEESSEEGVPGPEETVPENS